MPDDVDYVVNVSGQNVLDPLRRWTPGFQQNVFASRVETNRMLSNAIAQKRDKPPKAFVTISGVGFYPPDTDMEYTEDSSGGDHDFLSRLCLAWENASKCNDVDVRNVILRSGIVIGPNGGIIKEMYPFFWLGLGAKIGSGQQYMPWIHIQDLVQLFIESIHNERYRGVINAVAPQIITNAQFTKAFGRAMWRPIFLTIPEQVIDLIFSSDRAVMMTKGQKVISSKLKDLGFQFQFPDIENALKNVVK